MKQPQTLRNRTNCDAYCCYDSARKTSLGVAWT